MVFEPDIPPVQVHLCVKQGKAAIAFYEKAFDAVETFEQMADDGVRVLHANLAMFGSEVMLHDEFPEFGGDALAMFAEVDRTYGRLDAFVNNAGVVDMKARVDEMSVFRLERMMRINVVGSILCAREAVKRMSNLHGGAGGAIVNISSAAALLGSPGEYVDYAASKGGIDSLTIGLAKEVAIEGVRVNAVRPGIIDTEIHASGGQPDRIAAIRGLVPMKREGQAEEVARAVIWLLSDEASYTTGSFLNVSGGR